MTNNQELNSAYEKAIKLLSIRMHTSFELTNKLKLRGFAADVITETLEKLKEERFLNDDSVAEAYVDSLIRYKTFGYYGIMAKLKQKGINFDLAEKIVSDKLSTEEEEKIAKKLMDKNKSSGLKAAESLKRKGFRSQVIARVTKSS